MLRKLFKKKDKPLTLTISLEQAEEYADLKRFANMVMADKHISFVTKEKLKHKIGIKNFGTMFGQTMWTGKRNAPL